MKFEIPVTGLGLGLGLGLDNDTDNELHPWLSKNVKKNAICFKLFWYKVFVH